VNRAAAAGFALFIAACSNDTANRLCDPVLPDHPAGYTDNDSPIPRHFFESTSGTVEFVDNMPADNRVTNAGALLGRVLFYDVRLSGDRSLSCASCHHQQFGFGDTTHASRGIHGHAGKRRVLALANARFNEKGRFFWDERASSLEHQVLQPVGDSTEMGMPVSDLAARLNATAYYPQLFAAAFGSKEITDERISLALAQFVRSLISARSRFDEMFPEHRPPRPEMLTDLEREGQRLFVTSRCVNCHRTIAQIADQPSNNGLDLVAADTGAGKGRFKPASLRNVAVRPPYMHDGRFASLHDVVQFYSTGVKNSRDLDNRLRDADGLPRHLDLTSRQIQALVAFLESLTDSAFLEDARFSNPFRCTE
jgi:cytochrome c peroxidase